MDNRTKQGQRKLPFFVALLTTAKDLGDAGYDNRWGLVQAEGAISELAK